MGKKTDILNDFFASAEGQKSLKPDKKALQALKKGKAAPPSAGGARAVDAGAALATSAGDASAADASAADPAGSRNVAEKTPEGGAGAARRSAQGEDKKKSKKSRRPDKTAEAARPAKQASADRIAEARLVADSGPTAENAKAENKPAAKAKASPGKKRSFNLSCAGDLVLDGNIDALLETRVTARPDDDPKPDGSVLSLNPDTQQIAAQQVAAQRATAQRAGGPLPEKKLSANQAASENNPASLKVAEAAPPPEEPPHPPAGLQAPDASQAAALQVAALHAAPEPQPSPAARPGRKRAASEALSPHLQMSRLRAGAGMNEEGSPFQLNIIQSESLRLAQNKIADLEEELENQRRDNEKLTSSAGLLEESLERLQAENEELHREKEASAQDFANEKEVLLTAMEEGKKKTAKLEKLKKNLERRLSGDLQGIRARESALESKIEIMKIENNVVQKEKDKIIIEMKKEAVQMKENLSAAQTHVREMKNRLSRLNESLRRTVSVLRATVNNLEGRNKSEEEEAEKEESLKSA